MATTSVSDWSYDYSTIGSIGSEATMSLSGETINKLRAAEETAVIDPITEDIEDLGLEAEKVAEIEAKLEEFQSVIEQFDLYYSGTSAFDQISASTTGSSAVFDAIDVSELENGTTSISVTQLAQKDVYQTNTYTDTTSDITADGDGGAIEIAINGETLTFSTDGLTYEELATKINNNSNLDASVEEVGDGEYRIVIKSAETGEDNALTITQTNVDLGLGDSANHVQTAQNLNATVDGISYDVSSNSITVGGNIKITATDIGTSTLSIQKDYSSVVDALQDMADMYNELVDLINDEVYDSDSVISDKSTLRNILDSIKNLFFQNYGADDPEFGTETDEYGDIVYGHSNVTNNDKNIFMYGFSFDTDGYMVIDTDELEEAVADDPEALRQLFIGVAENEGIGTIVKEYIDDLTGYNGLLYNYELSIEDNVEEKEEEREDEYEKIADKYDAMAEQFVEFASMIAEMEANFSSLKMIIAESSSSD